MIEVLPGILAQDATELREKLFFPGFWQPGMTAHVDILDGTMFGATCFCDAAAIAAVPTSPSGLPTIELHCMVQNPMSIIEQWKSIVPETIRAIVHAEIERPIAPILDQIRELELETGVALCPRTSPDILGDLPQLPDRVLIMGVEPGASGQTFLSEPILAKIRRTRSLYHSLTIAVDGGMNMETAPSAVSAGANAFIATHAIWSEKRPHDAYQHLTHSTPLPGIHKI
ncbi:MAG: hypothetical protein AAB473_04640 [Patescibacteria group bacterium]